MGFLKNASTVEAYFYVSFNLFVVVNALVAIALIFRSIVLASKSQLNPINSNCRPKDGWEVSSFAETPLLSPSGGPMYVKQANSYHLLPPYTENASALRSMDFAEPVFTTTPQHLKARPMFYKSSNEDVAESMPDFPIQRSYQDVTGIGRIRRKSETCV